MAILTPFYYDTKSLIQASGSTKNGVLNMRDGDIVGISNFSAKTLGRINAEDWRSALVVAGQIPLSANMPFPAEVDGTAPTALTEAAKLSDLIELAGKFNRLINQLSVATVMDPRPSVFSKGDITTAVAGTTYDIRQLFVFPYYLFRDYYVEVIPAAAGTVSYNPDGVDSPSTITSITVQLASAATTNVQIRCWHRTADLTSDPYAQATVNIANITLPTT